MRRARHREPRRALILVALSATMLALALASTVAGAAPAPRPGPDVAAPGSTPSALPASARARSSVSETSLRRFLTKRMRPAGSSSGAWVRDLTDSRTLFERSATRPRILASNTKLFTTAAALDRLGPNGRLTTRVRAEGLRDLVDPDAGAEPDEDEGAGKDGDTPAAGSAQLDGGVLEGDLYLEGAGDPALGTTSFARRYVHGIVTDVGELARRVREAGIIRVRGRIVSDDSVFDRVRGVADSGFRTSPYIGPLSGLSFNSGFAGGIEGRFASDPAKLAGEQLRTELRRAGVKVDRGVVVRRRRGAAGVVAAIDSPPISKLARQTNVDSDNFFAETLLKAVGAHAGRRGSTKEGARVSKSVARRLDARVKQVDGSGLTRSNRAAPQEVGDLLASMADHEAATAYVDSLATAGRTGTLSKRMRGTAAQGRCRAKTGTVRGVSALSGYCDTKAGHRVAFSILMNGVNPFSARKLQDQMTAQIARYGG